MPDQPNEPALPRVREIAGAGVSSDLRREPAPHEPLDQGTRLTPTTGGEGGASAPPRPLIDVRSPLAALTQRIREAHELVQVGAPLPKRFQGGGTGWFGRLAIGVLRKLGRGLSRDERHATHAALLALESAGDAVNALRARQEAMELTLARELEEANRAREKYAAILSYLMSTAARMREIEARIGGLREPYGRQPIAPAAKEDALRRQRFAQLHARFAEHVRPSEALVSERLSAYLPVLRAGFPSRPRGRWLDVGCGRGEWLDLAGREGSEAIGVDVDPGVLASARAKSLSVVEDDVFAYLRDVPAHSFDGVSAFQLIDQIPLGAQVALLDEAWRVMRPGGMLIIETPDPANLQVGAPTLLLDSAQVRPLPPALLSFVVREIGWENIRILPLEPDQPASSGASSRAAATGAATELHFGPTVFTVVARKPA